jgi:DNA polymerase-3 subunit delta'
MPVTIYPWHEALWHDLLRRRQALPHALLFRGRPGIGKFDFVRKFAQSVACLTPATSGAACGVCESCRWFEAGNHPDYRELQPAAARALEAEEGAQTERKPSQQITIDEVRQLQGFIYLTAHRSRGKTIVLYPAEALNFNAANALLKNLEEPPADVRFMLVSHRPSLLPATVLSRCQQVALPTPSAEAGARWLRERGIENAEILLAQCANAPLAALELNDEGYLNERNTMLTALSDQKPDALSLAEQAARWPVPRVLGWLQRWSFDLLYLKSAGAIRYNPDFKTALARIAERLHALDIAQFHRMLVREQRHAQHPLNARLYMESLLFAYLALLRGERPMPI